MTVSRAINNKPGLSDELRQKILDLAERMKFQPNQIARGLATRQTLTIGLVVPDITNPFLHTSHAGWRRALMNTATASTSSTLPRTRNASGRR